MEEVKLAIWESNYPYLTTKGKKEFTKLKNKLPSLVSEDARIIN